MIELNQPPAPPGKLWLPARPQIIRPAATDARDEQLHRELARRGVPREVRRVIIKELGRVARLWTGRPPADLAPLVKPHLGVITIINPSILSEPAAGKVLTFIQQQGSAVANTTYTFSFDIGAGASDLRIIVGFSGNAGTRTWSSGTVDGVAAALVTDGTNTAQQQDSNATSGFMIAHVPSSSGTVNIAVTWSAGQSRTFMGVYRATGLTTDQATHVQNAVNTPANLNLNTSVAGFAVGHSFTNGSETATWTGLVEDADALAGTVAGTSASLSATDGSTLAISRTWTAAGNDPVTTCSW